MNRQIFRLAVPNILSNLSVPLLGIADTALMGRMESEIYIGAIALGGIIFNFIYWGFSFLRMGTTGLTAQAYGQADRRELVALLSRAMLVAVAAGISIILLQWVIGELGFMMIDGEEAVKSLGKEYYYIRVYAAPATLSLYAIHGWFLGMQNARFPMILTIAVNIFNIGLNFLFVLGFGMKSDGVALATVLAQYLGLAMGIWLFWWKYRAYLAHYEKAAVLYLPAIKRFFSVNSDIFIRTICLIFVLAFFTAQSSAMDTVVLAANQILLQYFYTMAFGVDGFAFAAESLVGRYLGEKNADALKGAIRWLFIWGIGIGVFISLVYIVFGEPLLYVFTSLPEVIAAAKPYMWWMVGVSVSGAVAFMWDGVYIGATASKAMRNTMLLATFGVFLPTFYLSFPTMGNDGLWMSMVVFMIARSVFLTVLAKREIFRPAGA